MNNVTDKNDLIMQKVAMMEAVDKVKDKDYQLMARIAIALYDQEKYDDGEQNDWITFSTLKTIMNANGGDYSEGWNNRGIASSVSTAQTYYGQAREDAVDKKEKKTLEDIRHAIAVSFRNKDGKISYNPEKPDEKIQVKS
ncbi:hypothetical protein [Wohlfahrtiimonas chitiniclastica]|uniref:hypothetical protein n=1 Tax=Wohlfahrtiimonas chitiniclastica TaxID=400946 RepID=UPI000B98480B|nr:hypothetical protein [Wohlfahrtiimonas chitiniclastica]OYQ82384.1 hypothetical protein B9T14_09980 [Wohlfahrtiimonas chitiniclastica]OYQ83418.1 hypothetical protein B9T15_10010 [Wohlfahrtiimonas chitiniclastica]